MKSLNRTLSLVLVLVMVLGMFGIAGATFTDAATVQYTEAVEVMAGIGAINGYADGSFKPTGTITREEAAKMITYAILGSDVASRLSVGATGFKDVDAGRWSAPFISYLVGKGIINGMGDGTFAPTANVTGYQLAKMMLCAAGHGAKGEFTGPGWELAVAVAANKTVFDGDKSVDHAKAATREEAALYVFNGITEVPMTVYNKLFDKYEPVAIGAYNDLNSDGFRQIAEEVYTKLAKSDDVVDGRTGFYWTLNGKEISSFVPSDKALASSTDGTALATLTNPASPKYIKAKAETSVSYYYNNHPVAYEATPATATVAYAVGDYFITSDNDLYQVNAAVAQGADTAGKIDSIDYDVTGVIINFLDSNNNGKYDAISIIQKTVSQLSDNVIVKTTGSLTTVAIPGVTNTAVNANTISYPSDLKKGDTVLFYASADGRTYVEKAQVVVGKATGYTNDTVIVGGKGYELSGLKNPIGNTVGANTAAVFNATKGAENTAFYLDNNGSIAHYYLSETPIANDKVLFISAAEKTTSALTGDTYKALAVAADGTVKTIVVSKVGTRGGVATAVTAIEAAPTDVAAGKLNEKTFYTYVVAADGSYVLNAVEATRGTINHFAAVDTGSANTIADFDVASATTTANVKQNDKAAKITKGAANFLSTRTASADETWSAAAPAPAGILANSSTVFVVWNNTTKAYNVYTGIANVPNIYVLANNATIDVMMNAAGTYASLVVVGTNQTSAAVSSSDAFFVLGSPEYVYVDGTNDYLKANVLLNGTPAEMKFATDQGTALGTALAAGKALKVATKIGDVVATVADHTAATDAVKKVAVADGTISLYDATSAGTLLASGVLDTNAKAFVLNITNKTFEPVALGSVPMTVYGNTAKVTMIPVSTTNPAISVVFVTLP